MRGEQTKRSRVTDKQSAKNHNLIVRAVVLILTFVVLTTLVRPTVTTKVFGTTVPASVVRTTVVATVVPSVVPKRLVETTVPTIIVLTAYYWKSCLQSGG